MQIRRDQKVRHPAEFRISKVETVLTLNTKEQSQETRVTSHGVGRRIERIQRINRLHLQLKSLENQLNLVRKVFNKLGLSCGKLSTQLSSQLCYQLDNGKLVRAGLFSN